MRDVATRWRGDVGALVGVHLAECLDAFLWGKLPELERAVLHEALDNVLAVLGRVIEMRFSMALYASTYALVNQGKKKLGPGPWGSFLGRSTVMPRFVVLCWSPRSCLLARNRSDKQIMAVLIASYTSGRRSRRPSDDIFQNAQDLDRM